jgi:hypothetical protein
MVELRTRKREMGAYGGKYDEKQVLEVITRASQFTIPNKAGTSPDPVCNSTDTRSFQFKPASRTPDYTYPFVSSTLLSSSSHISLFLVHNSTIIAECKVKSSRFILPCHDHDFALSIAYTEYSIHQVQHPIKIVCLPFILMITS